MLDEFCPGRCLGRGCAWVSAEAAAAQQQSESMSKFMKYFFPIFTGWICLTSNASFALYWVTSNIVAGISNYLITKHFENKTNTLTVQGEVK